MKSARTRRRRNLRRTGSILAGAVLVTGVLAAPPAGNPYKLKPGAAGKLCLGCHTEFEETMGKAHVHTPVRSGNCADCHDPHASSHGKLLASDPSSICLDCHAGIRGDDPVSVHEAVIEGNCTSCHDPHASENANVLVRSGNDLCGECHADALKAATSSRFTHAPAREDCTTCHDPHASMQSSALLATAEPELCVACHDPTAGVFRAQHAGYPVEQGRCTSCHDPHGSNVGGILQANVHQPVEAGKCVQCHESPNSETPLALAREGFDLCRGCHGGVVNESLSAAVLHWPVADRESCLNCHSPHASGASGLLLDSEKELCESCHADVADRAERSRAQHAPVADGACGTCHLPHGAEERFLFVAGNSQELCGSCHDWKGHSAHPIGEGVVDMRNPNLEVDCLSCHRSHGSPHEHLATFDIKADLCVDCHERFRR